MTDRSASAEPLRPRPISTEATRPFWDACRTGELHLPRCAACARLHYPPPPRCPHCLGTQFDWQRLSGYGRIKAWTQVYLRIVPGVAPPFLLAEVALDEQSDVVMTALLEVPGRTAPAIGAAVEMTSTPPDAAGSVYPQFRMREGGAP
jgi:uncharacterized OB-fold protein